MNDNSLLVRSNIICLNGNEKVEVDIKIPNKYENNNLLLGIVNYCNTSDPISDVYIRITNICDNSIYMDTITNCYGEYYICNIPYGCYKMEVRKCGCIVETSYITIFDKLINWYNIYIKKCHFKNICCEE